ncbi:MAG TPA: protein kinase [Longimicrobium sp.]|nr:protein kinase [Longimicrobium sp.]
MYGIAGLLTGRTLAGRYLIEAVIGRGGMGAVYRAADERLSRPVAVKVIGTSTVDPAEHARLRARFHREARAAAALHHANVVQVHDFGTDPELDLDFLVMELLRGEDLAARLVRTGAPPLPTGVAILRQAARGLSAGHRAGMVHRDVKPGNLFLETDDERGDVRVKVLDFGIAQLEADDGTVTHLTQYGRSPFSPAYASPEQLRGEDGITPASDVFSLSAVGYHVVTGRRAFTSSDVGRVQEELAESMRELRERAPALDDLTHEVLVRGLSWRPVDRFRDAAEMAEALGGLMPTRAGSAAPRPAASATTGERTRIWSSPTRAAPTPTPHARPVPVGVGADETQLAPEPARPRPLASAAPPIAYAQQAPALPFIPQGQGAPPIPQPKRSGRTRGFFRALWDLTVTAVSLTLFVGAWAVAIYGVAEDRDRLLYAGGLATLLMTPLAVHRLTGRRGRYSFGVVGSVLATLCAVRVVGLESDPAIGLAAVFGLQILACFLMSWLTKRKPREDEVALQVGGA